MKNFMEEMVTAWVAYARERDALLERIASLLRKTDEKFSDNDDLRDQEMKQLQRSFYRVVLAEKLRAMDEYKSSSPRELVETAEEILSKRGHVATYPPADDMRTADEEKKYVSLRVTWSNLLKKARVRAADNRGGPTR